VKTVTVNTRDHGPVTVPEPTWCTGDPHQQGTPGPRRSEIAHLGELVNVTVPTPNGDAVLLWLQLWQDAFPEAHWPMGDRTYAVATLAQDTSLSLDVPGLDQLADAMYDAARQIRAFANTLALTQPRGGER
jgi:hypothetical protein